MHNRITYKAGATKEIIHCYPREDRKSTQREPVKKKDAGGDPGGQ